MGSSYSTRKITFSNDDPGSVIKVSEAVARRLKGGGDSSQEEELVIPPPMVLPELRTTHQVRLKMEKEMQNIERIWGEKMASVIENQQRIDQTLQDEYDKGEQEIDGLLQTIQDSCALCQEEKNVVMDCYKQNPNKSLLCTKQVQAFSVCILLNQKTIMEKKVEM